MVSPEDTTLYIVTVFDGIFTVYDSTTVYIGPMPGLCATPTGETVFCQDPQNTTYSTEGAEFALSYSWSIMPETAGTITGEGDMGIVVESKSGNVDVKVLNVTADAKMEFMGKGGVKSTLEGGAQAVVKGAMVMIN